MRLRAAARQSASRRRGTSRPASRPTPAVSATIERQHAVRGDAGEQRSACGRPRTRSSPGLRPSAARCRPNRASAIGWRGTVERPEHRPLEPRPVVDDRADRPAIRVAVAPERGDGRVDRSFHHDRRCHRRTDGRASPAARSTPARAPRAEASARTATRRRTDGRPNRCRGRSRAASARPSARRRRWSRSPRTPRPCSRPARGRWPRSDRSAPNR